MKKILFSLPIFTLILYACTGTRPVSNGPNPFAITPSRLPLILSPTPILVFPLSVTSSPTFTPILPPTVVVTATSTETPTATFTYTPTATATPTATVGPIAVKVLGCETGLDLSHGMGEVTNAYVTISNQSGHDLTNACATLSAADEGRPHPNKTFCTPSLPTGYRLTLKLTIDTTYRADTIVQVSVTSDQGLGLSEGGLACNAIGAFKPDNAIIGVIQPIQ